jgi:hypothetical protein
MAPQPKITKKAVESKTNTFLKSINRARTLHIRISQNGYSKKEGKRSYTELSHPDKWEVAQFLFFELASKFEEYAKFMFQCEVRSKFKVSATRSEFVMGDPDNGLDKKFGWGSIKQLKDRGKNIFHGASFFGALPSSIGDKTYKRLTEAHTIRNRIAHDGGNAKEHFIKLLETIGMSAGERQGMSVGKFLFNHPSDVEPEKRYFFQYLEAYEDFANKAKTALP